MPRSTEKHAGEGEDSSTAARGIHLFHPLRAMMPVRVALVAIIAGAASMGCYDAVLSHARSTAPSASATHVVESFTNAQQGDCITWETTSDGLASAVSIVDCATPHRFEVSSRENLGTYPTSEFNDAASKPDVTRQAQLREELCEAPTMNYLSGRFDSSGRYSIASILPPDSSWNQGDRTMLCGVQSTDESGHILETTGTIMTADQSRVYDPGQCVLVDAAHSLKSAECTEDHSLEMTAIIDMTTQFSDHTPSASEQDDFLRTRCVDAAEDYLGSEENLYQSTLQPFWTTQSEASWLAGSHKVNCALMKANEDGTFSVLRGPAHGDFLIDGQPRVAPPTRNPLRTDEATPHTEEPTPTEGQ